MTTTITGVHPYADKFPMLPENELAELAESIAANGLRLPVVVTPDGLILDGRNRNEACKRAGVEPATTVYDGDDLAEYVIDANSSRRHMSAGARAMATALVLLDAKGRTNGRWNRDQGPRIGDISEFRNNSTWREAVSNAGIVLDYAPELAVQVVNGDMALDAAYRQACNNRDAETALLETEKRIVAEEETARTTLAEVERGQAYLDQVGTTYRTARQAWAAWEDDNHRKAAERRREEARKENDRKQREASMSDLFSKFADCVGTLSIYGRNDSTIMEQFHPRFVRPKDSLRYLTPEACRAAARFCETIATYMESRQA